MPSIFHIFHTFSSYVVSGSKLYNSSLLPCPGRTELLIKLETRPIFTIFSCLLGKIPTLRIASSVQRERERVSYERIQAGSDYYFVYVCS